MFTSSGRIPVELLDESDPVWQSKKTTRKFLADYDLDIGPKLEYGPINRCKGAGCAWAWKSGITRAVSWGTGQALDLTRMRELGIRGGISGGGEAMERLTSAGVRVSRESDTG